MPFPQPWSCTSRTSFHSPSHLPGSRDRPVSCQTVCGEDSGCSGSGGGNKYAPGWVLSAPRPCSTHPVCTQGLCACPLRRCGRRPLPLCYLQFRNSHKTLFVLMVCLLPSPLPPLLHYPGKVGFLLSQGLAWRGSGAGGAAREAPLGEVGEAQVRSEQKRAVREGTGEGVSWRQGQAGRWCPPPGEAASPRQSCRGSRWAGGEGS